MNTIYQLQFVYGHFNIMCIENIVKIDKSVICGHLQWWIFLRVVSFVFFRSGNTMVMFNFCVFKYIFVKLGFHDIYGSNR